MCVFFLSGTFESLKLGKRKGNEVHLYNKYFLM